MKRPAALNKPAAIPHGPPPDFGTAVVKLAGPTTDQGKDGSVVPTVSTPENPFGTALPKSPIHQ